MSTEFNELPVLRRTITTTITFDAFVAEGPDGTTMDGQDIADRIAHEIADAIEYRAVHLSDSEDSDALIALVDGGAGGLVETIDILLSPSDGPCTDALVQQAVDGTEAWI